MTYFGYHVPSDLNKCRRTGTRHRLAHAADASVELSLPDGRRWRLDLLDLSVGGMCFGLAAGEPILECGTRVEEIVVRVGGVNIEGSLTIAHATEEFGAGTICGAEFHPATELDQRVLEGIIAGLAR